ncbi:MAG: 50S ribosomal protein L3 N(5)-glutamine methyltransferase [Acidiferrobacteraceae bacterium]
MNARTPSALLVWGARRLRVAGVHFGHGTQNALEEASWLLAGATRQAPGTRLRGRLPAETVARYQHLIEERIASRRPAAYLLSEAWFAGRRFYVDPRVLIPRSLIGEFILERFAPWVRHPARVRAALDIGTGSGCIALALARAFPGARVDASDISAEALEVAARNVRTQRLGARVRLVHSDLFENLGRRRYDLIVSNPPYVTDHELRALPEEYHHEPRQALVAPGRGLAVLLALLAGAPDHLTREGIVVIETGNRAASLARKLPSVPFMWLADASQDESVALIEATALRRGRAEIVRALATLTRTTRRPKPPSD